MIDTGNLAVVLIVLCGAVVLMVLVDRIKEWWQFRRQPSRNYDMN